MNLLLRLVLKQIVNFLSIFIFKKKNVWLISLYNGGGSDLAENSLSFAYFLKKKNIKFKYINSFKIEGLEKNFIKIYSTKYIYYLLVSKILIVESDLHNDITLCLKKKTIKVNLFHGLATKKIYYSSKYISQIYNKNIKNIIKEYLLGFCYPEEYNLIFTSNKFHRDKYIKAFKNKNVYITGQCRNDLLKKNKKKLIVKMNNIFPKKNFNNKKFLLYLPTFRDKDKFPKFYKYLEDNKLENFLSKNNLILLVKEHSFYKRNIKNYEKKKFDSNNIIYLNNEFLTQELLIISNILINDYSGIYFDYLLLNKPIIFFCYDYRNYIKKHRGLYIDYFDIENTPGDKVYNVKELIKSIKNNLKNKHKHSKARQVAKKKYNYYSDYKNCDRVYQLIKNKIIHE